VRFSEVCIERPVFTTVMSLVIVLIGTLGLLRLSNRELPDIDPPVVTVTTIFSGASAEVVETSVTKPIEDAVNGIDGVKHVKSVSREQVSSISIEFTLARDIEAAANDVRDRVARIRSKLPDDVTDPVVAKQDTEPWLAVRGAFDPARGYEENTPFGQRFEGTVEESFERHPQPMRVCPGERRVAFELTQDEESTTCDAFPTVFEQLLDEGRHVDRTGLGRLAFGDAGQAREDIADVCDVLTHQLGETCAEGFVIKMIGQKLDEGSDRNQRIADLVRQAACEAPPALIRFQRGSLRWRPRRRSRRRCRLIREIE